MARAARTAGDVEALHGELPEVVAGVVEAVLQHGIVGQLLEHAHCLLLKPRLVERCKQQQHSTALWVSCSSTRTACS